jgi:hypothetical protein
MDQRSIALCFSRKGLSAKMIYQDFAQMLGAEVVACPTGTWYRRAAKCPAQSKGIPDAAGVTRTDAIDAATLKPLANTPFSSVRELLGLTYLSTSTIHRCLTEWLGFAVRHLHWVPIGSQMIRRRSGSMGVEKSCECCKGSKRVSGMTS